MRPVASRRGRLTARELAPGLTPDWISDAGLVFVTSGSLDPGSFAPALEMLVKRRLDWARPLGLPEFSDMPV